jgi:hypothetical protein
MAPATDMTYCVVPAETSPSTLAELRLEYRHDPLVSVIVDVRAAESAPSPATLKLRRPVLRWDLPGSDIPGVRFERHLPPVDVSLADLEDSELITRALEHDTAASTELRWRCYARVLAALRERTGSRQSAHELVPSVLEAMQVALPSYKPQSDFSLWLSAFVANMALDL